MDRSARDCARADATTFALGLWHAAMSLETSRHGVQLELSRAGLVQFAQHLVFSNHSRGCHAHGRFVPAGIAAIWHLERGAAVHHCIPGDGRASCHARLYSGTRTNPERLAYSADAPDLSSDAQLLHLESHPARHQRRMGQLGQTRTHRQRACASVTQTPKLQCRMTNERHWWDSVLPAGRVWASLPAPAGASASRDREL